MAAGLTVRLATAQGIPGAGSESAEVLATVRWGDAVAQTDAIKASAAAAEWGAVVELASPSVGLDRAASMHPYLAIDIYTVEYVGNQLRARLLVPLFVLKEAQVTATWKLGPPPGVVASKNAVGFGHLDAAIEVSPGLLAAIAALSTATAVRPEDATRLESLGQWNVQPSKTAATTVSIPGEEPTELVIQGIEAEVSGFKHPVSLRMVPSQLLVLDQQESSDTTAQLCLDCKDFRTVTFHAASVDTVAALLGLNDRISQWTSQLGEERAALIPAAVQRWKSLSATTVDADLGWELDLSAEFDRQLGGSWQNPASEFRDAGNSDYSLCDTYPKLVLIPKRASAELTSKCAAFRSKSRLPCLSWYSPIGCIYRCSQPMTGPLASHSPHDEEFVGLLQQVGTGTGADSETHANSKLLTIFDCRSHSAAAANSLKGAGLEDPSRYVGCARVFLDIGNIHAMRHSLDALMKLIVSEVQEFDDHEESWLPQLSSTGWLNYIRLLLGSSLEVALLVRDGGHALIHCSDGWDRTSQVCALAQLMLDPYFRTIDGFKTLVQKEFVAFGHMCRKRLGTVAYADQRSPCLLQFFECVHHIRSQFPTEFEFNDQFLVTLATLADSELFGDFLANSDKERSDARYWQDAPSIWGHLCAVENRERYSTVGYAPTGSSSGPSLLPVRCSLKYLHLWDELYCKYDEVEYSVGEMAAGRAVGKIENQARRMTVGVPTLKNANGQGLAVKCENVGVGERVSDGKTEHITYTFQLSVGSGVVGTFRTRYSQGLEAHTQFVQQGHLNHLDPPLEFPPKYWFRNMITGRIESVLSLLLQQFGTCISSALLAAQDEGNVRLRQHELQLYFGRLLGEAGLLALPEVRDSLGLSEETSTKITHLLTDV